MGLIQHFTPSSKPEILPQVLMVNPQQHNRSGWDGCAQKAQLEQRWGAKLLCMAGTDPTSHLSPELLAQSSSVNQEPRDTARKWEQHLLSLGGDCSLGNHVKWLMDSKAVINSTATTLKWGMDNSASFGRPLGSSGSSWSGCTFPEQPWL